jgi:hypothetical protein
MTFNVLNKMNDVGRILNEIKDKLIMKGTIEEDKQIGSLSKEIKISFHH